MSIAPLQSAIQTVLRNFLVGVLPAGTKVIAGQANRVAEPKTGDFVVFWPVNRQRLSYVIDSNIDAEFTGSIAGDQLDVTAVSPGFNGQLGVGRVIFGVDIIDGTVITALGTGTGGVGTYTVEPAQTVASETISGGTTSLLQNTQIVMQCDVHGPNSSDYASIIEMAIRDEVASRYFNTKVTGVAPLYADDPRQVPFINGENQFETRWIVDCHLQANLTVVFSQQFAATANVIVHGVEATP